MPKKFKKLSTISFASALAVSAIIPVVAIPETAEATSTSINEVVYNLNGQYVSLDFDLFTAAINADISSLTAIQFVKTDDDKYYNFLIFSEAINASNTPSEALGLLSQTNHHQNLQNVVKGVIENGELIAPTTNGYSVKSLIDNGILTFNYNNISRQISVLIDSTKLPNDLSNASLHLAVGKNTYQFERNPFKLTQIEVRNLDYSEQELVAATVVKETKNESNSLTVQSLYDTKVLMFKVNIINNTFSILIDTTRLPSKLKNKSLVLVLNDSKYNFQINQFKPTQIEVTNLQYRENELLTATIELQ